MKYKIVPQKSALQDFNGILEYLLQFSPNTPRKFSAEYKRLTKLLKDSPYLFEKYKYNEAYRKMVVFDYLAFYKVDEENKHIKIYRILHGAQDIEQILE